ncbi:hypothetical protein ACIBJI_40025 [Nocardia sp. NPDC050408]|uniref:hypothetical protein n=1 Tax=Nocardia sp. NPDC050408 TaxID=3364319 RepID=UPI00379E7120
MAVQRIHLRRNATPDRQPSGPEWIAQFPLPELQQDRVSVVAAEAPGGVGDVAALGVALVARGGGQGRGGLGLSPSGVDWGY